MKWSITEECPRLSKYVGPVAANSESQANFKRDCKQKCFKNIE